WTLTTCSNQGAARGQEMLEGPVMRSSLGICLLVCCCLHGTDQPAADETKTATRIRNLIDKLAEIDTPDIGYSGRVTGSSFTPLDSSEMGVMTLPVGRREVSNALRELVKEGVTAVPFLLEHLGDKRTTCVRINHSFSGLGGMWFSEGCDYNERTE